VSVETSEIEQKIAQGLSKLALAIRHSQQASAGPRGLSPTQAQILGVVAANAERGPTLAWLADWLGVTAATASDAVAALESKGLVAKRRSADDARRLEVVPTGSGREELERIGLIPDVLLDAVDALEPDEQAALLRVLVKLIRSLQQRGQIPVARMCATCQHFRPHAHADRRAPHHCAYVDAAFGDAQHMIDCPDHEPLDETEQEIVWARYIAGARGDDSVPRSDEHPNRGR
jgi:DNA-binding MarR family transcriptional regulator